MRATLSLACMACLAAFPATAVVFNPGNLVVAVSGNGVYGATSGAYADNQASPLTLFQYAPVGTASATYAGSFVLPQTGSGANYAVSAEYGSSSEGFLHLSGDGTQLSIAGYGVNAATFNANTAANPNYYGVTTNNTSNDPAKAAALAQSGSLTGQNYTPVARVVALIDANGAVDSSTGLFNVYNGNNPRAAYTIDGKTIYVSGQGLSPDATGGVFITTKGASTATAITGNDTNKKASSQDTRDVQVVSNATLGANTLTVSVDSKEGSGSNRDFVGTLGTSPTGLYAGGAGPTMLPGFGNSGGTGKVTLTSAQANGVNMAGQEINLSPEEYFFANATTLYVADSGAPKNDSVTNDAGGSTLGDGGLQKWLYSGGKWNLAYTLSAGLGLVGNNTTSGTTGLFGLTGQVVGDSVQLYATSYAIGDTDQTYLYGITDLLGASAQAGQTFAMLDAAPVDSKFRGLSFAPTSPTAAVPEPGTYAMMILGFGALGFVLRRRQGVASAA